MGGLKLAGSDAKNRQVVFVLGMHRTGTSAVTRILMDLGCALPGHQVPASDDNPMGYWEPREIVETHDEFVHAIGRTWSDPRPLADETFRRAAAKDATKRLTQAMKKPIESRAKWVIKDPRMCRLLPLWKPIFSKLGSDAQMLFVIRSPLAVAASLAKRDRFEKEKSLLLWLRHYLESEYLTRYLPRCWISFEKLTSATTQEILDPIRNALGMSAITGSILDEAGRSFDDSLVHHRWDPEKTQDELSAYPWVAKAWKALALLGTDEESSGRKRLDSLREEVRAADQLNLNEIGASDSADHGERYFWLLQEIEQYHRSVDAQRREIGAQRAEINAAREASALVQSKIESFNLSVETQRAEINAQRAESNAAREASALVQDKLDDLFELVKNQYSSSLSVQQERINALVATVHGDQRAEMEGLHNFAATTQTRLVGLQSLLETQSEASLLRDQERTDGAVAKIQSAQSAELESLRAEYAGITSRISELQNVLTTQHETSLAAGKERTDDAIESICEAQRSEAATLREASLQLGRRLTKRQDQIEAQLQSSLADHQKETNKGFEILQSEHRADINEFRDLAESLGNKNDLTLKAFEMRLDVVGRLFDDRRKEDARIVSSRLGGLESLLEGRIEKRHLVLLEKSLDLSARIESQWAVQRDQLDQLFGKVEGIDLQLAEDGESVAQFRAVNAEFDRIVDELDDARKAKEEILRSKTWRYTGIFRKLAESMLRMVSIS